jgi:hypothetical protein
VGSPTGNILTQEADEPLLWLNQTGYSSQCGALPGTICPDESDNSPFFHRKMNSLQGMDSPIEHMQVFNLQNRIPVHQVSTPK